MDTETVLQLIDRILEEGATYCVGKDAWTMSVPLLLVVYEQNTQDPCVQLTPLHMALEEGVRRGLWEMDYDDTFEADIVVRL